MILDVGNYSILTFPIQACFPSPIYFLFWAVERKGVVSCYHLRHAISSSSSYHLVRFGFGVGVGVGFGDSGSDSDNDKSSYQWDGDGGWDETRWGDDGGGDDRCGGDVRGGVVGVWGGLPPFALFVFDLYVSVLQSFLRCLPLRIFLMFLPIAIVLLLDLSFFTLSFTFTDEDASQLRRQYKTEATSNKRRAMSRATKVVRIVAIKKTKRVSRLDPWWLSIGLILLLLAFRTWRKHLLCFEHVCIYAYWKLII
jgi:hypothetical protein